MKILKGILLIISVTALIYSIVTTCDVIKTKKENRRISANVNQILTRKDLFLRLNRDEVQKYKSEIDSIRKAQNLRYNEVRTIDKVIYRNVVKLVPDTVEMFMQDTIFSPLIYFWEYDENCFHLSGQVWDSLLIINQAEYNDSIYTTYYRKRPKHFLFIKYGKWQYFMNSQSKCGDTKAERIFFE